MQGIPSVEASRKLAGQGVAPFMVPEGLFSCKQEPASDPYPGENYSLHSVVLRF